MQFIQATPSMQLVEHLHALEAAAQQGNVLGPFVPSESQANKGIDHMLRTCGICGGVWRSKEFTLCAFCAGHVGNILFLDHFHAGDLYDAAFAQKEPLPETKEQLGPALKAFRMLLREYAPWYDNTSRKLIQACYKDLCRSGGTHPKIALAIHFFKEEWKRAPEEEKTFCPE